MPTAQRRWLRGGIVLGVIAALAIARWGAPVAPARSTDADARTRPSPGGIAWDPQLAREVVRVLCYTANDHTTGCSVQRIDAAPALLAAADLGSLIASGKPKPLAWPLPAAWQDPNARRGLLAIEDEARALLQRLLAADDRALATQAADSEQVRGLKALIAGHSARARANWSRLLADYATRPSRFAPDRSELAMPDHMSCGDAPPARHGPERGLERGLMQASTGSSGAACALPGV